MKNNSFTIKDFYWFYIVTLLLAPVGFLIRIFYSKTLSVEVFAYIYAIIAFFTLIYTLTTLGLNASLTYYIPKFIDEKEKIRNSLYYTLFFYILLVIFITAILYMLRNYIAINYFDDVRITPFFVVLLWFFIGNSLFDTMSYIYVAFKMNVYSQGMNLAKYTFIGLSSVIVFLIFDESSSLGIVFAYIWGIGSIFALIFFMILFFLKNPWVLGKITWDKQLFKLLFSKGLEMYIAGLGIVAMAYIDIFLITLFLGVVSTGIYDSMLSIIRLLPLLLSSICVLLIPLFSELKREKKYNLINKHLNLLFGVGIFITVPFALTILIFSKSVINFLYASEFLSGVVALQIFAIFGVFRVISDFNTHIMNGLGLSKKLIIISFSVLIINLLFDLLLIPIIGITGAALVTGFGWLIYVVLTTFYISQSVRFKFNFRRLGFIILNSFFFLFMIGILKYFINTGNIFLDGMLVLGPGLIVYVLMGNYLKIITFEETLLFVPQSFRPTLISYKTKYFNFIK